MGILSFDTIIQFIRLTSIRLTDFVCKGKTVLLFFVLNGKLQHEYKFCTLNRLENGFTFVFFDLYLSSGQKIAKSELNRLENGLMTFFFALNLTDLAHFEVFSAHA